MTDRSTILDTPSGFTSPLAAEIDCVGRMVLALEERVKVLEDEGTKIEHPRIWTTGGEDDKERAALAVPPDRAVFFDTGSGVIQTWIEDGALVVVGDRSTRLAVRPEGENEIRVAVEGWYNPEGLGL